MRVSRHAGLSIGASPPTRSSPRCVQPSRQGGNAPGCETFTRPGSRGRFRQLAASDAGENCRVCRTRTQTVGRPSACRSRRPDHPPPVAFATRGGRPPHSAIATAERRMPTPAGTKAQCRKRLMSAHDDVLAGKTAVGAGTVVVHFGMKWPKQGEPY